MRRLISSLLVAVLAVAAPKAMWAQSLAEYTAYPAFLSNAVPPIVMLVMARDHKLFYKAYNDVQDLDEDGTVDATYKDTIEYYGYFDSKKCYTYDATDDRFEPSAAATGANLHYCSSQWSGNFLNWATMARLDVVRKVLYGGYRTTDTTTDTALSITTLPRDAHSWAKVYEGGDISSLTPNAWTAITFCVTNTDRTETAALINVKDGAVPYAASTGGKQCVKEEQGGAAFVPDATYEGRIQVCVAGLLESNCEEYDNSGSPVYKPTGMMQRFGMNRQGTTDPSDDVVQMKFGLITGSYGANVSGGVLRSNVVDLNNEITATTGVVKSGSDIIKNINNFRTIQYDYSTGWWDYGGSEGTCVPTEPVILTNGECRSWGNPIGEMLYETIRYIQGKSGPTTEFKASPVDPGISGLTVESSWTDPYATCPYCSQPFALIISDAFTSFDSDDLPGSYWPAAISTSDTPSVQTLVANSGMNTLEGIGNVFIGESAGTFDRLCSSKSGDFASIRGLCVEEPTKQGAYYLAGLAHYAKTTDLRGDQAGDQKLTTYTVVTATPVPKLEFDVNGKKAQVIPIAHDGCPVATMPKCTAQGDDGDNSKDSIVDFQICRNDADWTAEQGNGFTSCFDIMWDDAEYGWDYELDVRHRLYVKTDGAGGTITIKNKGLFAAAGHRNYVGYAVSGVSGAGDYYDVACGGDAHTNDCDKYDAINSGNSNSDNSVERTFTVTGSTAGFLKEPLWYAAKYGGFTDKDGDGTPNLAAEWDKDADGTPDNYFFAANPLKLEEAMAKAFLAILNRASAGSAASVLASSSTGEGALYQSFFFPTFFEGLDEIKWTGATQGLFLDAFGNLREDTNGDGKLIYEDDQIVRPVFDATINQVQIQRYNDSDANGLPDTTNPIETVGLKEMKPIWEAGTKLANTNSCARKVFTWVDLDDDKLVDAGEQIEFNANCAGLTSNTAKLAPYLRAGAAPYTAENIINFIRGDQIAGMRNRQMTVGGSLKVWKLGDPIHAQPIVVGPPTQRFDLIYGDTSYTDFFSTYKNRRHVAYIGANDGMLHAFNAGFFIRGDDSGTADVEHGCFNDTASSSCPGSPPAIGNELWGFIPQELLPQLQWLTRPDYTHVYYVDLTPKVTEVRIFCDAGGSAPSPCLDGQTGASHPNGWGTILMGGFRLGGSCGGCTSGSGAPPMTLTGDFDNNAVTPDETRTFYSAYFVLDVTDPERDPKLLWSFSSSDLGLTAARPSMLRVNPASAGSTDHASAKWYMLIPSGPTGYDGSIAQASTIFAFDLTAGPGANNANVTAVTADSLNSFLSDAVTIDKNLDYRVDVAYTGGTINDGALPWRGKLYRLTMNNCGMSGCAPDDWGIALGATDRQATEILDTFVDSSSTTLELGPVTASPSVTVDQGSKMWVFAGTGRLFDSTDRNNTDPQYMVGVKDGVLTANCTETTRTNCHENDLVDVSSAEICVIGIGTCGGSTDQVTGVSGASDFPSLISLVASKDGWFTALPASKERALSRPLAFGGLVLFPTFVPNDDECQLKGESYLYALYYLTGSAYSSPVIGTTASGSNKTVNRSTSLGVGMASQAVVHIGKSGSGGKMTAYVQKSSGELSSVEVDSAAPITSRFVSWYDAYD